jgi:hypothetical protein
MCANTEEYAKIDENMYQHICMYVEIHANCSVLCKKKKNYENISSHTRKLYYTRILQRSG